MLCYIVAIKPVMQLIQLIRLLLQPKKDASFQLKNMLIAYHVSTFSSYNTKKRSMFNTA